MLFTLLRLTLTKWMKTHTLSLTLSLTHIHTNTLRHRHRHTHTPAIAETTIIRKPLLGFAQRLDCNCIHQFFQKKY